MVVGLSIFLVSTAYGAFLMNEPSSIVSSIYRSGKLYDLYYPMSKDALAYWLALGQRYGDPILEIMCGTGAYSIPLAQQEHRVTGVDLSQPMLAEAKRKSEAAGVSVEWVVGDVRHFELGQQYKLIVLPSNSICHLLTRDDLEACLASVMRHLHPDGRFALAVFVPSLPLLMKTLEEEQEFVDYIDPDSGQKVVMTNRSFYDAATQIKYNHLYKRIEDGPVEPDGELTMRMYFPQELDALLWYNGFAIEHKYGSYDRRPFDAQSSTQCYILRRR
jgi:ubiquinone/menaquinone biosynthesis C-methylase UbiE